jgi:hypothetical protein
MSFLPVARQIPNQRLIDLVFGIEIERPESFDFHKEADPFLVTAAEIWGTSLL